MGGALLCCLISKSDSMDSHLTPKLDNLSNVFLFLNGLLIPSTAATRTTLAEFMGFDKFNSSEDSDVMAWDLDKGYTFRCKYICAKTIKELLTDESDCDALSCVVNGDFRSIIPVDKTANLLKLINEGKSEEDMTLDEFCVSKMESFIGDDRAVVYMDEKEIEDDGLVRLVDYLGLYCYSNIISSVESEIKEMSQSSAAQDIPWTNDDNAQTKWLAKIRKSIKDDDLWNKIEEKFVVNWNLHI